MRNTNCIDTISPDSASAIFGLPLVVRRALRKLGHWMARSRQRRQLEALNDAMLKDIGLTRADVRMEAERPFWRA